MIKPYYFAICFLIILQSCIEKSNSIAATQYSDSIKNSILKNDALTNKILDSMKAKSEALGKSLYELPGIAHAEKVKQITQNAREDIKSKASESSFANVGAAKIYLTNRLKSYVDSVFQVHPFIWMNYRKEFPLLIEDLNNNSVVQNSTLAVLTAENILSTIQNRSITFCNDRLK